MTWVWIALALIAHEAGHALAVLITRAGKLEGVVFDRRGVGMAWAPRPGISGGARAIVTLAGPAANFIAAGLFWGTDAGFINLIFGAANFLIPLKHADGRRAFEQVRRIPK